MKPVRDITVLRRKAAAIKDLDKGIKDLLIGLWRWGVETEESCEGHVFRLIPFPFVRFPDKDKENVETIPRAYGKCDWEITRALNGSAYYLVHPRIIKGKYKPYYILRLRGYHRTAKQLGEWLQDIPDDFFDATR